MSRKGAAPAKNRSAATKFLTPRFVWEITHGHHQWRWKRKPYKTSEVCGGQPVLENGWRDRLLR
jgi:hypothetical protein